MRRMPAPPPPPPPGSRGAGAGRASAGAPRTRAAGRWRRRPRAGSRRRAPAGRARCEVALHARAGGDALAHGLVADLPAAPPPWLGPVRGGVGIAHDVLRPLVRRQAEGDPDAGGGTVSCSLRSTGAAGARCTRSATPGRVRHVLDALEQDRELVARRSGDTVSPTHRGLQPAAPPPPGAGRRPRARTVSLTALSDRGPRRSTAKWPLRAWRWRASASSAALREEARGGVGR